jgi:hypothetical protein
VIVPDVMGVGGFLECWLVGVQSSRGLFDVGLDVWIFLGIFLGCSYWLRALLHFGYLAAL